MRTAPVELNPDDETSTPGCYDNEGKPTELSRQNGFYFVDTLEGWREAGDMKGLELAKKAD